MFTIHDNQQMQFESTLLREIVESPQNFDCKRVRVCGLINNIDQNLRFVFCEWNGCCVLVDLELCESSDISYMKTFEFFGILKFIVNSENVSSFFQALMI